MLCRTKETMDNWVDTPQRKGFLVRASDKPVNPVHGTGPHAGIRGFGGQRQCYFEH